MKPKTTQAWALKKKNGRFAQFHDSSLILAYLDEEEARADAFNNGNGDKVVELEIREVKR
jgi:hypothetical protein